MVGHNGAPSFEIGATMKRLITALALALSATPALAGERLLITDVRLGADLEAPRVSLLLEHGRISNILTDRSASIPGVRSYSGEGRWLTPALIDAWTSSGVNSPDIVRDRDRKPDVSAEIMTEMRAANRKGIRAGFSVAETLSFEGGELSELRGSGVGTLHVAPSGELLGGKSAVISASEAAAHSDQADVPQIQAMLAGCAEEGSAPRKHKETRSGGRKHTRAVSLEKRKVRPVRTICQGGGSRFPRSPASDPRGCQPPTPGDPPGGTTAQNPHPPGGRRRGPREVGPPPLTDRRARAALYAFRG